MSLGVYVGQDVGLDGELGTLWWGIGRRQRQSIGGRRRELQEVVAWLGGGAERKAREE
jgi:hypothetical protein